MTKLNAIRFLYRAARREMKAKAAAREAWLWDDGK